MKWNVQQVASEGAPNKSDQPYCGQACFTHTMEEGFRVVRDWSSACPRRVFFFTRTNPTGRGIGSDLRKNMQSHVQIEGRAPNKPDQPRFVLFGLNALATKQ
jgi:hypothetical protein